MSGTTSSTSSSGSNGPLIPKSLYQEHYHFRSHTSPKSDHWQIVKCHIDLSSNYEGNSSDVAVKATSLYLNSDKVTNIPAVISRIALVNTVFTKIMNLDFPIITARLREFAHSAHA